MAAQHKLMACRNRFLFQLDAANRFLALVNPILPGEDDNDLRQMLFKSLVMMVQSYFEEYLRCIVATATFWNPHCLRHTFATRYLAGGGDIYIVSKILGHSSVLMTERVYAHPLKEDLFQRSQHVQLVKVVTSAVDSGSGEGGTGAAA